MLYVFNLCDAADVKPIINFQPYPPQHLTIESSDGSDNAFPARVAIFTQPAPLAASNVTKHPRQVQTNLESFSFYRHVACYHPLWHSSVPIFCNVSRNYE
jgi:hypothetical protein